MVKEPTKRVNASSINIRVLDIEKRHLREGRLHILPSLDYQCKECHPLQSPDKHIANLIPAEVKTNDRRWTFLAVGSSQPNGGLDESSVDWWSAS